MYIRFTRSDWWALAIFVAIFLVWIPTGILLQRSLAPPAGANTLTAMATRMPPPTRLSIVTLDGQDHVLWIGQTAPFPALPSGPACYLFDSSGNLVDWTTELGEGHRLDRLVGQEGRSLTLPEALAYVEQNKVVKR